MRESEGDSERAKADGSDLRSGDFSKDPAFDPAELFDVIGHEESVDRVVEAMREFQRHQQPHLLARGIALFARSARARGESVESVLGALETIADQLNEGGQPGFSDRETPLRNLLLRGVLLAYYGADAVRREDDARRDRMERRRRSRDERV